MLAFSEPDMLWLLLICLIPLLKKLPSNINYPAIDLLPQDQFSRWYDYIVRAIGVMLIASVVAGLAGIHKQSYKIPRIGTGAHVILLLDRSRSMDQTFATKKKFFTAAELHHRASKITVARRVLNEFVEKRKQDWFAMTVFSTLPISVVPLTNNQKIIKAAIDSSAIGRGLAQTNIGLALESAIHLFDDRPFTGSRIIILISDGAAKIDSIVRKTIRDLTVVNRVTIYWMYMRSATGPAILGDKIDPSPELALHRFFSSLDAPYRAYMVENAVDLKQAIADVDQLQNIPLQYNETIPRRNYAILSYKVALVFSVLLLLTSLMEVQSIRDK